MGSKTCSAVPQSNGTAQCTTKTTTQSSFKAPFAGASNYVASSATGKF